jgi:hypothetical protein
MRSSSVLDRPTDTSALDHRIRQAAARLECVVDEMNASGTFMDPEMLRRLRACVTEALRLAVQHQRIAGTCGYGCPWPGLECPERAPLANITQPLTAAGFVAEHSPPVALEPCPPCVCGSALTVVRLRRGEDVRSWAVCELCGHWLVLEA